jgi:hypothetical protein
MWNYFTREINCAQKIRVYGRTPLVEARGQESLCGRAARVGDTNICTAEFLYDRRNEVVDRGRIRNIDRLRENFCVRFIANFLGSGLERLRIAGAHRHLATLRGKGLCGCKANAFARSRHYRNPALESDFHKP